MRLHYLIHAALINGRFATEMYRRMKRFHCIHVMTTFTNLVGLLLPAQHLTPLPYRLRDAAQKPLS